MKKFRTPYQYQVYMNRFLRKGNPKNNYSVELDSFKFYRKEYAKWRKKKYTSKSWKTRKKNMLEKISRWAWEDFIRANIAYHTDAPFNLYEEFGPLNPVDDPEAFLGSLYNKWISYVNHYFNGDEEWAVYTSRALTSYYNRESFEDGEGFSM